MRSKILQCLSLLLLYCLMAGSVIAQQGAGANQPSSTTDKDWWKMMQDPNANFFETQKAFYDYWSKNTYTKGSMYKVFKRWEMHNRYRADKDGKLPAPDNALKEHEKFSQSYPDDLSAYWTEMGPVTLPANGTYQPNGMGRVNGMAFHPTNADLFYAAAPSGGLWQRNGDWWPLTDFMPTLGTSCVVVDPSNPQIIYLGTGDRDADNAPGQGVYKSTNGGSSFTACNNTMGNVVVNMLAINPLKPQSLFAATGKGVYRTFNGGQTWKLVSSLINFKDLAYHPTDTSIVYATSGGTFYKLVATSGGNGYFYYRPLVAGGDYSRLVIGVSPAQPDWVYLCAARRASPEIFSALLRSANKGEAFETRSTSPNILGYACGGDDELEQSGYDLAIAVNPTNANMVFVGGINIWKSEDGGSSWDISAHWNTDIATCPTIDEVHADIHYLGYNPVNNVLYTGCDGGVYYSSDNGSNWVDISSGLGIAQIYRIGMSQVNENHILCGFQDNGTAELSQDGSSSPTFETIRGGDGLECLIDYGDEDVMYLTTVGNEGGSVIHRDIWSGQASIAGYNTNGIDEISAWELPYMLDRAVNTTMYAGFKNVWKSTDIDAFLATDVEWTKISSGETAVCNVLEQSRIDLNLFYVSRIDTKSGGVLVGAKSLKRTDNGGSSWINCVLPDGEQVSDIEPSPWDVNTVYVTAGKGVYKSTDRGDSWENITGNLPNVPKFCLTLELIGFGSERIYVGTEIGVFYKNEHLDNWISFNTNLPLTNVKELDIYYGESRLLRAATYGRGMWQSPVFTFPDYPTYVRASDKTYNDRIHVKWAPAEGKTYYKIYRGTFNNPSMADPISGWITDLEFDDYSPMIGITQFYWVQAADDEFGNNATQWSESDGGSTGSATILTEEVAVITDGASQYYTYNHGYYGWAVIGVKGADSESWKIDLYDNIGFQTIIGTSEADTRNNYVVVDNYHAPNNPKGIKVTQLTGGYEAEVEFEDGQETISVNESRLLEWGPGYDVAKVFNVHLTPGKYFFGLDPAASYVDLDIALYGSVNGDYYQSRGDCLAYSVHTGEMTPESFIYEVTTEDDYGIVVFANNDGPFSGNLVVETVGLWTGLADNNWHNPANWTGHTVPDATIDVSIPPVTNQPWVYAGPAYCRNLTIQPGTGTYLRVFNQTLTISGDLTIHRELMMDNPTYDARVVVNGHVFWKTGSTANFTNNTMLEITGDMVVENGSLLHAYAGNISFTGSNNSLLTVYDENCYLPNLHVLKSSASLTLTSSTLQDVGVYGYLIVYPDASFFTYSNYKLILKGSLQVMGGMFCNTGITEFQGPSQSLSMSTGSFFRHLNINTSEPVMLSSDIEIRGNLSFLAGSLHSNANIINIQGDWINSLGSDAFVEGSGRVVFAGGNYPQYCSNETFNILELNKFEGGALRVWGSIVGCAQYDWTAGAIDVNIGYFQANDLVDNGIFGDWYVNPLSFVNLSNYDGPVDLNGNLLMLGGNFDVFGGTGSNSYWSLGGNAGLLMADGVIDFHDVGIQIPNTGNSFLSIITGGTIRSSSDFGVNRTSFAPSGGTVELYGSGLANLHMEAGNFWDVTINKASLSNSVDVLTNLTISNDLNLTKGVLNFSAPATIYVARDLNVDTAIVRMNSENDVLRVARHYNWNAGSAVQMYGAGTFRALGNWTYAVGSNVNMTQGNVNFLGDVESIIYCNESNSKFYNLWVNKTGSAPVTIDYYSSDTLNVLGDLLIFNNKNLVSHTPWPIQVQGVFDNDGHYKFNNGEITLHTPYAISPGAGDYFSTLRLQGPALTPFTFDFSRNDTLRVNLDVNIVSGGLNMMNKILAFGRHWNNMAGESAFVEGSGQVIANGFSGITQNILNDETFHNFTIQPLHVADYPVVSLYSPNRTLNVGHDLSIERGKLLLTQQASLVIGNDFVLREQGSLYGEASNALISLPGNWYDYTAVISNETGFTYGNTTVTFNGTPNQYIYQYGSGLSAFYNLDVYKYGGTLQPQGNVEIRGNLTVQLGNYERVDNSHEIFLYGNLSTNPGTGFYPRGILRFFGNSNTSLAINGNGWLGSVVVNKAEPTNSVSLLSNVVSMNSGELSVYNGQLNLGSHYYRCTAAVNVSTYGKLSIGDDGWLEVGGSSYLNVNGTLEVLGSAGHEAKVTHHSGYYDFDINSGASIAANHAIFEYMTAGGLHLWGGANVDASNSFNNCTFRYGIAGGTLFTVDNAQDMTATNVNFPANMNGCTYNVSKTVDQGNITFLESTGVFSGETFENDVFGRVNWGYPVKNLSLIVNLEGLFNTATGQMNKAHNATGEQFEGLKADEVSLELRSSGSPYSLIHSANNLTLNMDGSIVTTLPGNLSGSYYVAVKNRNHLETWSAAPISFAGSTISYNFTDAAARAYGSNQKEVMTNVFGLYAGDANQDGAINADDAEVVTTQASLFTTGYVPYDINGDGSVDALDLILIDNNAAMARSVAHP